MEAKLKILLLRAAVFQNDDDVVKKEISDLKKKSVKDKGKECGVGSP
jgi:hypothetical protein